VTPSSAPTTDYQVANKKYVDDNSGDTIHSDIVDSSTSFTTTDVTFFTKESVPVAV